MLEAALTVVDGCPAGAAAVVPEGVQAAVVVPEDAAWRCRQRYTHREKQEDAGKAVICMWPCILSSFKFIVHIRTEGCFFRRSSAIFLVFLKLQKQKAS